MQTRILVWASVLLACLYAGVEAKGARGGGSRGGASRGSRGSSYRGSSSYRGRSYRSVSLGSKWWVLGAAGGYLASRHVYGVSYYQRRRIYNSNKEPQFCMNYNGGCLYDNATANFGNGTAVCMVDFICPLPSDPDSYTYCCGDEDEGQKCCGYWGSPGRTAGAVIGFIILAVVLLAAAYLLYKCLKAKKKRRAPAATTYAYTVPPPSVPSPMHGAPPSYNDAAGYKSPDNVPPFANDTFASDNPAPYPTQLSATPYPTEPGAAPYPTQLSATPYPTEPGAAPYPVAPYPTNGAAPYPVDPVAAPPYPTGAAPYPSATGYAPPPPHPLTTAI